jgi:hypothetical protein
MLYKETLRDDSKKEKASHHKELSSLRNLLSDYKVERKANWKASKNKMNNDIEKIEKSLKRLVDPSRK